MHRGQAVISSRKWTLQVDTLIGGYTMRTNRFLTLFTMALLGSATAFAGDTTVKEKTKAGDTSVEQKKTTKEKTAEGTEKTKMHMVVGTVKEYEAGNKIKVTLDKGDESFDLHAKDTRVTVSPGVMV